MPFAILLLVAVLGLVLVAFMAAWLSGSLRGLASRKGEPPEVARRAERWSVPPPAPSERNLEIPPPASSFPPEPRSDARAENEGEDEDDSLQAFVERLSRGPASGAREHAAPLARIRQAGPKRIVFLHGFAGFSELGVWRLKSAYFRGVDRRLRARGIEPVFLRVSPFASIMVRAAELAAAVRALGPGENHLVAHSMGGLDARFALSHLGLHEHVASLVTVATPHRGTPIADLGSRVLRASRYIERTMASVLDLTTERMAIFEAETPDVAHVHYACVVASPKRGVLGVGPWLLPTYTFLRRVAGDNDGVVPVSSQRRGRELGHIDADHWGSVGWGGFDAPAFYEDLALRLLDPRVPPALRGDDEHRLPLASAAW